MRQLAYEFRAVDRNDVQRPGKPDAIELIGGAVLRLRLYRGWRQIDLERRSGVDQTTISRLERGRRRGLSLRRLATILDALGVGEIQFIPAKPAVPLGDGAQAALEAQWSQAERHAWDLLRRPTQSRTTISARTPSEIAE